MARFARLRNGVERPQLFAGARIVGARIAGDSDANLVLRVEIRFSRAIHVRADDDDVLVDCGDFGEWHIHLDLAIRAELRIELASGRVEGHQPVQAGEDNARRIIRISRPISDSALRDEPFIEFEAPNFLAGFGLKREDAVSGGQIHHVIDDDGSDFVEASGGWALSFRLHRIRPGLSKR